MDPNATLKEMRAISNRIIKRSGDYDDSTRTRAVEDAESLAERVQALDEWIRKGGFLPADWSTR